jgi:hypothetical protein
MVSFKTRSSHVRTFESCKRKWSLNELFGFPDPDTMAKLFGTKAHKFREDWLRDSKLPTASKEGLAAQRGLNFLPAPGAGLLVEHAIEKTLTGSLESVIYTGAIDLVDMRSAGLLLKGVRLYDHKFTGNLKWAKTADELSRDVSAVFYAMEVRRLTREAGAEEEEISARWLYGERESTRVKPVDFVINRANQRERWAETLDSVGQMKRHADQMGSFTWKDVEPNYDACNAYGGCPFKAQCTFARVAPLGVGAVKETNPQGEKERVNMGLLDSLRNSEVVLGDKVAATPAVATLKAVVQSAPPVPTKSVLAGLLQKKAAPAPVPAPEVMQDEEGDDEADLMDSESMTPLPAMMDVPLNVGVVPPDAPEPDLTKDTVEKKKKGKRQKKLDTAVDEPSQTIELSSKATEQLNTIVETVTDPTPAMRNLMTYTPEVQAAAADVVANFTQPASEQVVGALGPPVAVYKTHYSDDKVADVVRQLRIRAERFVSGDNLSQQDRGIELFVVANIIERGGEL